MSLKIKAAAFLTVMSSWFGTSNAAATNKENTDSLLTQTGQTYKPVAGDTPKTADFVALQHSTAAPQSQDSIRSNIAINKEVCQDSLIMAQKQENLKNAQELMLYVIAHFEGMKSKAYYDKAAGIWTINLGNTVRPDGKKVRSSDRIHNGQEALDYVSAHVNKHMADNMIEYLPLHKMSKEEIAIIGSLCYNCGTGILRNKDKSPSRFAKTASEYFTTHGDSIAKEFDKAFLNYCKVKQKVNTVVQERRKNELTFLHGDVKITIDDNTNDGENVINLKKAVLGTLYGCKGNPKTIISRFSEESNFHCPTDSLQLAINKQLNASQRIRQAPVKKKTPIKRPAPQKRPAQRLAGGR